MQKKNAVGGIEMLLALLIITLLFLYFTGNFFDKNGDNSGGDKNLKDAKEKIDVQLDELQKQRQDLNNETQRRLNELNSAY